MESDSSGYGRSSSDVVPGADDVGSGHLIAVVRAFLIGCAVLLAVGCAGTRSESSKKEQGRSPEATQSEEEARCEGTRTYHIYFVVYTETLMDGPVRSGSEEDMKKADKKDGQKVHDLGVFTTNDLPGCPKGGLLSGTDKKDNLDAREGDDEVRGLDGTDDLDGGDGSDTIYGGDDGVNGGNGEDVLYGGDGNDIVTDYYDERRDKLYCGKGRDEYVAVKNDYVDSTCEKKVSPHRIFGGEA